MAIGFNALALHYFDRTAAHKMASGLIARVLRFLITFMFKTDFAGLVTQKSFEF